MAFFNHFAPKLTPKPARLSWQKIMLAWFGAFLATAILVVLTQWQHQMLILGSFGASCLLIFAYPESPFSQPRHVIGGHFIASLIGLVFLYFLGTAWYSVAAATGTAIALMLITRTTHPPAGSNPIIVMLGMPSWSFLLYPTLFGAIILVMVAWFYNNVGRKRHYPEYW